MHSVLDEINALLLSHPTATCVSIRPGDTPTHFWVVLANQDSVLLRTQVGLSKGDELNE